MPYNWGPNYIVPSEVLKTYSGIVVLREDFDEELLGKELEELGFSGPIKKVVNPWYYRRKNTDTWVKVGESSDQHENFPAKWDTSGIQNGQYEIMGLMHVFAQKAGAEAVICRENVVEVTVKN